MDAAPEQITCPVCACPLGGPVDVCTACQTPHHQDCARFLGRCAIFGCGCSDFLSLDSSAASVIVKDATIDEDAALPAQPAPRPRALLRRTIRGRARAALELLRAEPGISAFLLAFMLAVTIMTAGALGSVATLLGQAMLVIYFSARAKGKESTIAQAFSLAGQRAGRIITTAVLSWILSMPLLGPGLVVLLVGAFAPFSLVPMAIGAALSYVGLWLAVSFSLALPIAAMDPREEPEGPLARSTRLVSGARGQATVSYVILTLSSFCLPFAIHLFPFHGTLVFVLPAMFAMQAALQLFATMYWLLFYLEARKAVQAEFLPYAPVGFLPGKESS